MFKFCLKLFMLIQYVIYVCGQSCSFGYHAGGWGKPPVDESGKPLYGDVFGPAVQESQVFHNYFDCCFL